MQNPVQNLDKVVLFSSNKVFCLKDRKLWRPPTEIELNIFCGVFALVFHLLSHVQDFLFWLDLELFTKIKEYLVSTQMQKQVFYIFSDNLDLNKMKNIPNTLLQKLLRIWHNIGFWQSSFVWRCFVLNLSSSN